MNIWAFLAVFALNFVVAAYAGRKGKNKLVWFIFCWIITPFLSAIVLFFTKPTEDAAARPQKSNWDLLAVSLVLIAVSFFSLVNTPVVTHGPSEATASATADSNETEAATSDDSDDSSRFLVSGFDLHTNEYGGKSVSGLLTNKTDKQFSYVQIELNVYDEDGTQLGSDLVNVNNLEPHARWKFDTPILQGGVHTVKIKNISAF